MLRWRLQTTSSASSGDALDEEIFSARGDAFAGRFLESLGDGSTELDDVIGDVDEEDRSLSFVLAAEESGERVRI